MTEDRPDIPKGALETLLRVDDIDLPGTGAEREICCFNPHHGDKMRTMRVNVCFGCYYCHGCGTKGNAWNYLTEIRKYPHAAARHTLTRLGWETPLIEVSKRAAAEMDDRRKGLAKFHRTPPMQIKKNGRVAKCVMKHDYHLPEKGLKCRRQRYERVGNLPKMLSFTVAKRRGGWREAAPHESVVPEHDRVEKLPLYRLPDLLKTMKAQGRLRPVWIVEDERCVDFVLGLRGLEGTPKNGIFPTTCLFGGEPRLSKHDFEPLRGRECRLIAGRDDKVRRAMVKLAGRLEKLDCEIELCLADGEYGYDIADAITEGGYQGMMAWIKKIGVRPWLPWESDLKEFLADLPPDQWAVEFDKVFAVCGFKPPPYFNTKEFRRVRAAADRAGWKYERGRRYPFRDKQIFFRIGAKPENRPRGRPFASRVVH